MVAKMLGILPNCFASPSKVSRTSGAAFSFTSGLTMAMQHLLICEGITWSQESIPNAAQLGTDTGIPTSLTNSPQQRTRMVGKPVNRRGQGISGTATAPVHLARRLSSSGADLRSSSVDRNPGERRGRQGWRVGKYRGKDSHNRYIS